MHRLIHFSRPENATLELDSELAAIWRDISALRHRVYSGELNQYPVEVSELLEDPGEQFIALIEDKYLIGYVSLNHGNGFRLAKYFSDEVMMELQGMSVAASPRTIEVRALTLREEYRGHKLGLMLVSAALKYSHEQSASDIIAMGHADTLDLYRKMGLNILEHHSIQAGDLLFHPMHLSVAKAIENSKHLLQEINLESLTEEDNACYHGGASWDESGFDFERRSQLVVADVLDSPFPPCPEAIEIVSQNLESCFVESPPTQCEPLIETISQARNIPAENILVSSGSSSLMFSLLPQLINEQSRVLILSPMYGEYLHILTHLINCHVTHFPLLPEQGFQIDEDDLIAAANDHDALILVNPNSPTGVYSDSLTEVIKQLTCELVWIDETYIDYVPNATSLESLCSKHENLVICKSMSKCYALSGMRVAYAVSAKANSLRKYIPPWAVSLPAQLAATKALQNPQYYQEQYAIIHANREHMATALSKLGFKVYPGVANYLLTKLPDNCQLDSEGFIQACREYDVFIRNAENMGTTLNDRFVRFAIRLQAENQRVIDCVSEIIKVS